MRSRISILLAAWVLCAGCLFSNTRVFEFDVIGNGHFGESMPVRDGEPAEAFVELVRVRTYEESRGEIEVVDRVGFAATIENPAGAPGRFTIYISDVAGLTDPSSQATRVLATDVPADGGELTFEQSENDVANLPALRSAIEQGEFHLYVVADPGSDLSLSTLLLVVSMTVDL